MFLSFFKIYLSELKKMKKMKKLLFIFMLALFSTTASLFGQGVTTSSIRGIVVDNNGKPLNGVTIAVVNMATGSQYSAMSFKDGSFKLQGLQVGGPYKVVASSLGFEKAEANNLYLSLNQVANVKLTLVPADQKLNAVTIKGNKNDFMSSDRTGAETSVGSKDLKILPSISRGEKDFTRLTPQSDGNSFGGRNNLYNNFSLDGSIFNNSFGLDYATPGGQADAQPVSLDAIKQIQVSLAPFDVRQGGFSGAGINAVTKSGTNKFKSSIYYYGRNKNMIGSKVGDTKVENYAFNTLLTGLTLGGPIIKNKLFFFVSLEAERRDQLAYGFVANDGTNSGPNVTSVDKDSIQMVHDHLLNEWGYEAGRFEGYNHKTYNNKALAKINWNINKKHKFTFRYNMLNAWKDILPHPEAIGGRGPTSYRLPFENSSYKIFNNIYSFVSELNSRFNDKIFNKVLISYTMFKDHREPWSKPFPVIDILDKNKNIAITAGSEMFSTHNILNQNISQFTDNLTYYSNKHTITGGINLERFNFENSFNLFYYPWHTYTSVQQFLNQTVDSVDYNKEVTESNKKPYTVSHVDVVQAALYVQDEFDISQNFTLTYGLRVDVPFYLNKIAPDTTIQNFKGWRDTQGNQVTVDPSIWPKNNLMWSPRIGFNWNVLGDNTLKIRGGTGIFTGRIPFVWLGNQATNSRLYPGYTFQINSTQAGFRFPQVWKSDLAVDYNLHGWIFTVEGIFGKDINAVVHRNYNMLKPTGKLSGADNRAIFSGFNEVNIYSSSPNAICFLDAGTIIMENVEQGYQAVLTTQVKKNFDFGLNIFAAYTYTESKDYTSIPAEIAADAFQRNPIVGDPNQSMLSYSRYGLKHRFIASAAYRIEYKNMATSVGLFYQLAKGNRFSYTYAGDLNQDMITNNDLLFVPANSSEIHFGTVSNGVATVASDAAQQWTALNNYINQDPYLSTRRGKYAERNGAMLPWFSELDMSVAQDLKINIGDKKNILRLSIDVMNLGNMLNSHWGVRQLPTNTHPITVNGVDANNVPYFSFDKSLTSSYIDDTSILSKWQMQFGIRYIFE